jgi:hypothetical protein
MENELCFVQFIHPGGEHGPDVGRIKRWNREAHKRKFLKSGGAYISDGKTEDGEVVFWGEWEPESEVVEEIRAPLPRGPRYVHRPYYVTPRSYEGLQNTDPFVFGGQFFYTGCQQRTRNGPTQLRYLAKGSVILFGSCVAKSEFVIDTVFVVDDWMEHSRRDYWQRLAEAPETYKDVTISPWYQEPSTDSKACAGAHPSESWRLYFGVTHERPLGGMFSYFPCLPYGEGGKGFARPRIRLDGIITDNLTQGKKLNPQASLHAVKRLWDEVTAQVREQALALGVYAEMPPRRAS